MSWSGISSTTWPTNNDVLDAIANGVFTLKLGQSVSANNNWITVAEANAKLNITTISGTSTRWPVKSEFVSSVTYYPIGDTGEGATDSDPSSSCAVVFPSEMYFYTTNSNGIVNIGDYVYIFNGSSYVPYPDTSGTSRYISYFQGGVRVWIEQFLGLISDKGNC